MLRPYCIHASATKDVWMDERIYDHVKVLKGEFAGGMDGGRIRLSSAKWCKLVHNLPRELKGLEVG